VSNIPDWLGRASYRSPNPPRASDHLVFVATFADGTKIRMSVHAFADALNAALHRAGALARAAYQSRRRPTLTTVSRLPGVCDVIDLYRTQAALTADAVVPEITSARFESAGGAVLKVYAAYDLKTQPANRQNRSKEK
jgi:hypothetical protein